MANRKKSSNPAFNDTKYSNDKSITWGQKQETVARAIADLLIAEWLKNGNKPLTAKEACKLINQHTSHIEFKFSRKGVVKTELVPVTEKRVERALSYLKGFAKLGSVRVTERGADNQDWLVYANFLASHVYSSINTSVKQPCLIG